MLFPIALHSPAGNEPNHSGGAEAWFGGNVGVGAGELVIGGVAVGVAVVVGVADGVALGFTEENCSCLKGSALKLCPQF